MRLAITAVLVYGATMLEHFLLATVPMRYGCIGQMVRANINVLTTLISARAVHTHTDGCFAALSQQGQGEQCTPISVLPHLSHTFCSGGTLLCLGYFLR